MTEEEKVKPPKDYNTDEIIETMFNNFFKHDNILNPRQLKQDGVYEYGFEGINNKKSAITKLIAYGIITIDDNNVISLTKEGDKVVKIGSWKSYLKRQKYKDILEKFVKFYLPILSIIITLILGVMGLCYTIKQSNYNEKNSKANTKQSQKLDSLELIMNKVQIESLYLKKALKKQDTNPKH